MKFFAEKEAEIFLKKEGFNVIKSIFVTKKKKILPMFELMKKPIAMKVSGKKIVHKNTIGGVRIGIDNPNMAVETFERFRKLKDSEGVIMQEQIRGRELILGIKRTPEFGHVILFGVGGVDVEKINKITFRVCPLDDQEIKEMVKELKLNLTNSETKFVYENIRKLCLLVQKYPNIKELDINPLMLNPDMAYVVDARFTFD